MSNAGCKDAWTLQCLWEKQGRTGDIATETSGISDNSEGSEEIRSDFVFL